MNVTANVREREPSYWKRDPKSGVYVSTDDGMWETTAFHIAYLITPEWLFEGAKGKRTRRKATAWNVYVEYDEDFSEYFGEDDTKEMRFTRLKDAKKWCIDEHEKTVEHFRPLREFQTLFHYVCKDEYGLDGALNGLRVPTKYQKEIMQHVSEKFLEIIERMFMEMESSHRAYLMKYMDRAIARSRSANQRIQQAFQQRNLKPTAWLVSRFKKRLGGNLDPSKAESLMTTLELTMSLQR